MTRVLVAILLVLTSLAGCSDGSSEKSGVGILPGIEGSKESLVVAEHCKNSIVVFDAPYALVEGLDNATYPFYQSRAKAVPFRIESWQCDKFMTRLGNATGASIVFVAAGVVAPPATAQSHGGDFRVIQAMSESPILQAILSDAGTPAIDGDAVAVQDPGVDQLVITARDGTHYSASAMPSPPPLTIETAAQAHYHLGDAYIETNVTAVGHLLVDGVVRFQSGLLANYLPAPLSGFLDFTNPPAIQFRIVPAQ